jgi:hypothetical protein
MADLFEQYGIDPKTEDSTASQASGGRDLFADFNIKPDVAPEATSIGNKTESFAAGLDSAASAPTNALLHKGSNILDNLIDPAQNPKLFAAYQMLKGNPDIQKVMNQATGTNYSPQTQQAIHDNPYSNLAGNIAGNIALTSKLPLSSATGLTGAAIRTGQNAGYGAVAGGLFNDDTTAGASIGAKLGTALGLASEVLPPAIKAVGSGISNIYRGTKLLFNNPDELANAATSVTLNKVGGDFSKATPEDFANAGMKLYNNIKQQKDELYAARDALAAKEGVKIKIEPSIANDINFYAKSPEFTKTNVGQRILGKIEDEQPLSYPDAQKLVSFIGKNKNDAFRRGNGTLGNELSNLNNRLLEAIDNGPGSEALKQSHQVATDFYKNNYKPIADMDIKNTLMNKYTDEKFMFDFVRALGSKVPARKALEQMPDEIKQTLVAAHTNALKDAAINADSNLINIQKYAQSLSNNLKNVPELYGQQLQDMQTLASVLSARGMASKVMPTDHGIGQTLMVNAAVGGASSLVASAGFGQDPVKGALIGLGVYTLPKTRFLFAAGRMINNPAAKNLLQQAARVSEKTDPRVKQIIFDKVNKSFNNQFHSIPASLMPAFEENQQNNKNNR